MKKFYLLSLIFSMSCLPFYGQWVSLNNPTNQQLNAVYFTSAETGYVVGLKGEIFKTVDGGNNWIQQQSNITANIFSIYFTNDQDGYLCAGDNKSSYILNTTNGGNTWEIQATSDAKYLLELFFINDSVGFCVGYNGKLLKTTDGGQNWVSKNTGTSKNLRSVYFVNKDTGFIAMEYEEILKTTDGGESWISYPSGTSLILLSMFFVNDQVGFAVGGDGIIVKTTDGGETWTPKSSDTDEFYQTVHFLNPMEGYAAGGRGTISYTSDGGETWASNIFGNFNNHYGWYGMNVIDNLAYVVGYLGNVAKKDIATNIELAKNTNKLRVFPNPGNGLINIDTGNESIEDITVHDIRGNLIRGWQKRSDNLIYMDVAPGIYFITVQLKNENKLFKIVIDR